MSAGKDDDILGALRDHNNRLNDLEEKVNELRTHRHQIKDKLMRFTTPPIEGGCDEPHLGLARTEELLAELVARFEDKEGALAASLVNLCRAFPLYYAPEMMKYRTVDS